MYILFFALIFSLPVFSQNASADVYDGTKAGVMLVFEHATSDQLPEIEENLYDMVGTMGPLSERVGTSGHITQQQLLDLQAIGFEISSHSTTHELISDSTPASVLYDEIVQSKIDLENMGFQIHGYIAPYNILTIGSFELIKNNYEWTTFWGPIQPVPREMTLQTLADSYATHGIYHEYAWGVGNGYTMDTVTNVKNKIDEAIANNYLIAFKFHQIIDGSNQYLTSPAMFAEIIDYVRLQRDLGNLDVLTRSQGYGPFVQDTTAPTTTASPPGGTYSSAQLVTLTPDEAATIYYTTDGSTPTTSSPVYSTAISISATTTLRFLAVDTAGNTESVKSEVYTINDSTAPTTTASPPGGTYSSVQLVTLTADEAATIYYTTDGSTPDTTSTVYTGDISISATTTLRFLAVDNDGNAEAVKIEVYLIDDDPSIDVFGIMKSSFSTY